MGALDDFINQTDPNGCTPLHAACQTGSNECVWLLAEARAKIDIRDNSGLTPLEMCTHLIGEVAQVLYSNSKQQPPDEFPSVQGCKGLWCQFPREDSVQITEIICYLGHAMGESPPLRDDCVLDIEDLPYTVG